MDEILSQLNDNIINDQDYEEDNRTENRLKNFTFVRKNSLQPGGKEKEEDQK